MFRLTFCFPFWKDLVYVEDSLFWITTEEGLKFAYFGSFTLKGSYPNVNVRLNERVVTYFNEVQTENFPTYIFLILQVEIFYDSNSVYPRTKTMGEFQYRVY